MDQNPRQRNHQMIMTNREALDLTDITDVGNFDDTSVQLSTGAGDLTIHGNGLQITQLDLENGNLSLIGKVDSLVYSIPTRGLFGRLFR